MGDELSAEEAFREDEIDFDEEQYAKLRLQSMIRHREYVTEQCRDHPAGTPFLFDESEMLSVHLSPDYHQLTPEQIAQQRKAAAERRRLASLAGSKRARRERDNQPEADPITGKQKRPLIPCYDSPDYRVRRSWYSWRLRCYFVIMEHLTTRKVRLRRHRSDAFNRVSLKCELYLDTYKAAEAYTLQAEQRALLLLQSKVSQEQYEKYLLTGFLVEQSKRTGLHYIFRRMRPCMVYRVTDGGYGGRVCRFIAALCIHPQGYYSGTWAGTMVPTDDVITQLLLMRGDERDFWDRSNHHSAESEMADV